MSPRRVVPPLVLLAVALIARGPLHLVTFGLPVSNDDAILLLMGRHLLHGELATTLWNQPYNGALDAYLLAPLLAVLDHHSAYRLYQVSCAVLLVALAGLLARRLAGETAGWWAALLAACGTPYMALMATTGPPPNFLMPLLTGLPLVVALAPGAPAGPPRRILATGLGWVCGLAVWNSSLAIPAFAGMGLGLVLAGWRPRLRSVAFFAAGAALGAAPLVVARLIGASGAKFVTAASAVTALRPRWLWAEGVEDAARALVGLLGLQVPLVVDGPARVPLPILAQAALAVGLLAALSLGSRSRRALPLLGWAAALVGAFWLARRTDGDDLRYLYGVNAPLLALAGCGLAAAWRWRKSAGVALAACLLLPWAAGSRLQAGVWRDPGHAVRVWEVPSLAPALAALGETGVRSAYASLQIAGRITLESEGAVIASQSWNERIPGDPLRFRDVVDLDPAPAFVLSPRISRGMPRAAGFREVVRGLGGTCRETEAGDLVVFHGFHSPYDESRPVPEAELELGTTGGTGLSREVLDRDPATGWTSPAGIGRGSGLVVRLARRRPLSALVLLVSLEASPLAVPWTAMVGGQVVAQGPARAGFQWVNGAPRAGKQALLAVPLGGREADEVRLVFQGPGPRLEVFEVFLYGTAESALPEVASAEAAAALEAVRAERWEAAAGLYRQAIRLAPHRASWHAGWARASWRARGRRWLDVEGLDDGGPELVGVR